MTADHVGGGDVPLEPPCGGHLAPDEIDDQGGYGNVESEEGEGGSLLVDQAGLAEEGEAAEEGGHDGQGGDDPALVSACEIIVFLRIAAFYKAQRAQGQEQAEIDAEHDERRVLEGAGVDGREPAWRSHAVKAHDFCSSRDQIVR